MNSGISDEDVRERISNGRIETLQLKIAKIWDLIVLPKNELLCACKYNAYTGELLVVYDENFNLLGEIDKIVINETELRPTVIAVNNRNEVYITNIDKNCVFITDMELKKLKSFSLHRLARSQNVCCKGDFLYACDLENKQVNVYNLELDLLHTIDCACNPKQIEVSDTAICVNGNNGTYFYSMGPEYKLLHRYQRANLRRISVLGSNFYEFSYVTKLVSCFDTDGALIEDIDIERICQVIPGTVDVRLVCISDKLVVYIPGKNIIYKLF